MKKYRTTGSTIIAEHEIVNETEFFVVYINFNGKEFRESKNSRWAVWHDSRSDAFDFLVKREQSKIDICKREIKSCEERLLEIYRNGG